MYPGTSPRNPRVHALNTLITLLITFLITIVLLLGATAGHATNWTVCAAGCDSTTIQGAVQTAAATGDTITLLATGPHIESNILIDRSLLIQGQEGFENTLAAAATRHAASDRIFTVLPGGSLEVRDLILKFGNDVDGGAILNQGVLVLTRLLVEENDASNRGGAVHTDVAASTVVRDTTMFSNVSGIGGGALSNQGYLRVEDSWLSYNESQNGGAIDSLSGGLVVERTILSANGATIYGGAVRGSGGSVALRDSQLSNNFATLGGALSVHNSTATVVLRTTVNHNAADSGGGAYLRSNTPTKIINSTVSSNGARGNGGGIYLYGQKYLSLSSVTITSNIANSDLTAVGTGGGIFVGSQCDVTFCAVSTVTLRNTLLGGNRKGNIGPGTGSVLQDCVGVLTSDGYNVVAVGGTGSTAECEVAGDLTGIYLGTDPGLDSLADHGGVELPNANSSYTQSLLPTSPALNHGHPGGCRDGDDVVISTDQRYAPRVGSCEIGAFEVNGVPMPPDPLFSDGFESGNTFLWSP